jgi:hypothetical protein
MKREAIVTVANAKSGRWGPVSVSLAAEPWGYRPLEVDETKPTFPTIRAPETKPRVDLSARIEAIREMYREATV